MKKTISLILSLVLILSTFSPYALAKEITEKFSYTVLKDGTVEITKYNAKEKDVVIPAKLNGKKVSSIGERAFGWKRKIRTLKISEGITKIGEGTFFECISLKTVTLPKSLKSIGAVAFGYCRSLEAINIPDGIKKIENNTFDHCDSLKEVVIPSSVTEIGNYAFFLCGSLKEIFLPDSVKSIGDCAFANCVSLETINIPDGIEIISEGAFWRCKLLKEIKIPDSVTEIGSSAFGSCVSLSDIALSKNIKKVGDFAFEGCESLEKIALPSTLKYIGKKAFLGCTALKEITMPRTINNIYPCAFKNTAYWNDENNWKNDTLYIENYLIGAKETLSGDLKIQEGTRVVDYSIFDNCKELTSVYIPKSVISFAKKKNVCFDNCTNLKSITVDEDNKYYSSVLDVLYNKKQTILFRYPSAKEAKVFNLPKNVSRIENSAFNGSKYLTKINFDKDSKVTIGVYSLYKCNEIKTITIPKNAKVNLLCGIGFNSVWIDDEGWIRDRDYVKDFVLKGYAGSDAEEYAKEFEVKFVSLCKNGKAHKTVKAKGKASTYFELGYTAHRVCTVCGEKIGCNPIPKKLVKQPKVSVSSGKGYIAVTYNAVKNANGFQVIYKELNGKEVRKIFMANETTTVKITGLPKGIYKVRVRAMLKKGNQRAYSILSFDGKADPVRVR